MWVWYAAAIQSNHRLRDDLDVLLRHSGDVAVVKELHRVVVLLDVLDDGLCMCVCCMLFDAERCYMIL